MHQGLSSLLAQNFNSLFLLRVENLRGVCRYPLWLVGETRFRASLPRTLENLNTCFLFLTSLTLTKEIEKLRKVFRYPPTHLAKFFKLNRTKHFKPWQSLK